MIRRTAEATLLQMAKGNPVLAISGPRQSGKTTLARACFPDLEYVSLEDPDQLRFATEDPRRFLDAHRHGAIFDEIQRVPELYSYLQGIVDASPSMGRFVLTGSQQLGLMSGVTQSLAGRVGMVQLLPFSLGELQVAEQPFTSLDELLFKGLYPPVHDRPVDPRQWYSSYVATYIERDVRQLVNVRDLNRFRTFVRLCAGRCGQILNLSELADDTGVSHGTARSWISVLEASFIIHLLPPHFQNFSKRLIKSPKLYFMDSGLAAWLLGIETSAQVASHAMRGALFENWVVSELLKHRWNRGLASNVYYWRDHRGLEVDVLLDNTGNLTPIEIKSGSTVSSDFWRALVQWRSLASEVAEEGWVIYGGKDAQTREAARVLPWSDIGVFLATQN